MLKHFLLILLVLTPISYSNAATPTWHSSKIKFIYPLADGRVVLRFVDDSSSCQGNVTHKYHYLSVGENGVTPEGLKNMMSVALTAATTNKKVSINFDADSSGCQINRLYINFE